MKNNKLNSIKSIIIFFCLIACNNDDSFNNNLILTKSIGDFESVFPTEQTSKLVYPLSHKFQKIISAGDLLTNGGIMPIRNDFAGFVPINNSSEKGFLSINSEATPGGVTILDISINETSNLWEVSSSTSVDFSNVVGTRRNCSGAVTPWNTILTCEESYGQEDFNADGYKDFGWTIEVDPITKEVLGKRWALGRFPHENACIHKNERTLYQGVDSPPNGFLYKFVAFNKQDLSSGRLLVYKGEKNGIGEWIEINNTTVEERNSTLQQSHNVGGTIFAGIEDVEIGPDGMIYFAVKGEGLIYRFKDEDAIDGLTVEMEPYVGNRNYNIGDSNIPWGLGNDNLAFDGDGNLWVLQDGDNNYIWVVGKEHTETNPKVKLFGIAPRGAEPTGITFTPDYKYLFMSIQHPDSSNADTLQIEASNVEVPFDEHITIVFSVK